MDEIVAPQLSGDLATRVAQLMLFTDAWLENRRLSDNTRIGYRVDVRDWLLWCRRNDVDPIQAKFTHVNAWGREMENPPVGRPMAATTIARKMSAVSSWYAFLVKLGALAGNPASVADRPRIDRTFTATVSFDADQAARMAEAAAGIDHERLGAAGPVLADWLVDMGTRATETCQLNLGDLSHDRGHRVVFVTGKGGKRKRRTVPPPLAADLDRYLAGRFPGGVTAEHKDLPLFADVRGGRVDRYVVTRYIRRIAKAAGVPQARQLSAHSTRHAFVSISRENGATLEQRQEACGHVDPRTTQRYDHNEMTLEQDPALLVARAVRPGRAQAGQGSGGADASAGADAAGPSDDHGR